MKLFRFHRPATHKYLRIPVTQQFLWLAFFFMLTLSRLNAQAGCDFFGFSDVTCSKATVFLSAATPNLPAHHWDFGDGTPILTGGSELESVEHDYFPNINPYRSPQPKIRHSADGVTWCEKNLSQFLSAIMIGNGCGTINTVSNLIANQQLPPNELAGITLYVFGNLEVDVPYKFDGCTILVSDGGEISVKSGGALTLNNNTMVDAFLDAGSSNCQASWNGIKVFPGGTLTTNVATIRNAYFAVSAVNPGNINPLPKLSLRSTTFQRNFVGLYAATGSFVITSFVNNTFQGAVNLPIYPASSCNPPAQINGAPFAQRTYCGIYFDGSLGGSLFLAGQSTNNLFKDMQAGIVCINGTSRVTGCRFENIVFLTNAPATYQGTALTFIDNTGGKRLNFVGLGKANSIATINNCERGVYVNTSKPMTEAYVSSCRMLEVQNGVELEESGAGNFARGSVYGCYIGCTKYLPNIKMRSTGIEIKDPNIAYSNFDVSSNDIDVDQPEGYTPAGVEIDVLPTAISGVGMHFQASNNAMLFTVANNMIDLIKGVQGVILINVANANVANNQVNHDLSIFDPNAPSVGIYVLGGVSNTVTCNSVHQTDPNGAILTGLACEGSPRMTMSQNNAENGLSGISFAGQNETDCTVSYNNLSFNLTIPINFNSTGIFYRNAQTGPQYLKGNDWFGDFQYGSWFYLGNDFSYCNSRYHVSPQANVNNATNPVDQGGMEICPQPPNNWFTTIESQEDDYACGGSGGGTGTLYKNEADLNLAGGGTMGLSPGYKWSSETGLYRKFTDNPGLIGGDVVINGFLQAQQGLPTAAMYAVQNSIRDIEGNIPAILTANIENTLAQLEATEAAMLALLENIETDPNALASYTTLSTQIKDLETLLNGYLTTALNSMAQHATAVATINNGINCSNLPCTSERYINGLYLETQIIAPRPLTMHELQAVEAIGLYCPKDAGNIVYMARAWYYFQTCEMLHPDCGSFAPPASGERNVPSQLVAEDDMVLMPNPADGSVQILLPANRGEATLTVHDMWGKLLFQRKAPEAAENAPMVIPVEGFSDGIYLVVYREQSGKMISQKLSVQH